MTTETRIIVRPAPDALRAGGPIKPLADAPTPSDMEEKPPAPASKKHSGDPEVAKAASASKKPANDMTEAKETQASEKRAKDAGGGEEAARFQEAHGRDDQSEGEAEGEGFAEAHAEGEEGDCFFEARSEEARGEEARCQAASEDERLLEGGPEDPEAAAQALCCAAGRPSRGREQRLVRHGHPEPRVCQWRRLACSSSSGVHEVPCGFRE
ncbi:hypothetical protein PF010_g32519 [Phytophthora fragariae]|uniref:Uncharacterized protein n=1 Tax=Phytophthora fragariae TaxID=53985 RepID=A0A6G0JED2_9STRA|nr:hypothetical protein PF010_g32519 [Phytophthora fragariae]